METFDVGYVPTGWVKGEKLRIETYRENPENFVIASIWRDKLRLYDNKIVANDVAALTVHRENIGKVNKWLAWWEGKDD